MDDVSTEGPKVYRPCQTCGKLMELPPDSKRVYCSPECAGRYRSCVVCGRWFLVQDGGDEYCSEECRQVPPFEGIILDLSDEGDT